jgi:integrase
LHCCCVQNPSLSGRPTQPRSLPPSPRDAADRLPTLGSGTPIWLLTKSISRQPNWPKPGVCQQKSKWIEENYAAGLKAGKVVDQKIVPLEPDEQSKILEACDRHKHKARRIILKAMILVLRWTGLRIRDVVTLSRDAVRGDRLFLRTTKTGTDVFAPLPPQVVVALAAIPAKNRWYFWDGTSEAKIRGRGLPEVVSQHLQSCRRSSGPSASFRHTFATDMLERCQCPNRFSDAGA